MSTYRYKIRLNYPTITGGTVEPMVNVVTGTQQFTDYLTTYAIKPGQSGNQLQIPKNIGKNYFTKSSFSNLKTALIENIGGYFDVSEGGILISSGNTINPDYNYKNINIPINVKFEVVDYSDDIDNFIEREKKKSINPAIDGEKVKYISENYNTVTINFRFYNKSSGIYDTPSYITAGFVPQDIGVKNNFKKSFFRLYFYDSNDNKKQNLLLTEDISANGSTIPSFNLDKIYWLMSGNPITGTGNKKTYMEARFFNAKTGRVHRFFNVPIYITSPITVSDLANNQTWKTSQITILSPNTNNGNRWFRVEPGIGANTQNTITMTEFILST